MKFCKGLLCAALSVAALAAATPASAQRVTRIVAFGDSYADDGNLFELLGIPRPAVYPNGRFSDGTNFVDTMSLLLGAPVDNFAIGGAFTGTGNINGPGIPGFVTEWQSFLAGGGPSAFPRVNGTFGPNDLLVISIGGNDARAYERSLGLNPSAAQISGLIAGAPAQAAVRVTEATAGLNALVAAGARNITFLAGDVGRLPEVAGLPVAAVGTAYATAFNTGMQAQLATLANRGVIVNYLDLNLIGDRVQANLAAFGLQSAGACPIACVTTDPGLLSRYLFYVDQVHLTSAGFAIVGRYAVRQLEAPLHLQGQAEVGLQTASSFGSTLLGRLDLSAARAGAASAGGLHFYIAGNTASADRADTMQSLGYEMDTFGATAGAEYDIGGGAIFGAAVNYSRGEADMITGTGRAKARGWQAGIYGGWTGGGAFVEGYAGYGWLDYDIVRTAVIDDIAGETDGTALTAGGQAGYLFGLGGMRLGPVIGLRYARVEMDGFTETGDPVLTLNVQDQKTDSLVGSAGLELRGDLEVGGLAVRPYAQAALEQEFAGDSRTVRYALTAAPTIVNQWVLPDRPDDLYGRVTGGVNFDLTGALSVQVNASTTLSNDLGDDVSGFLALRLRM
ncbi:MAG TPA: autotransporter domain-containing protein [Allosphingosinicella sp.]|nr:autotransporter domain-containing protein [Allosphingosinicella sp.]